MPIASMFIPPPLFLLPSSPPLISFPLSPPLFLLPSSPPLFSSPLLPLSPPLFPFILPFLLFPSPPVPSFLCFTSVDTEHVQWLRSHLISSPSSSSFLPSSYLLISPSSFPCLCFPSPLSLPLLQLSNFPLFIFLLPTLFIVHTLKAISICHIQSRFMTLSILYILQCILSSLHTPSTCTRKESIKSSIHCLIYCLPGILLIRCCLIILLLSNQIFELE